jgi:hypothetical protein
MCIPTIVTTYSHGTEPNVKPLHWNIKSALLQMTAFILASIKADWTLRFHILPSNDGKKSFIL